jgi:5'-nucleotidase
MIILLDVDGVCADLCTEWLNRYNRDYGDDVRVHQITEWEMEGFVKPECGSKIYQYLADPDLYDHVKPIFGAIHGVSRLHGMGHRIVYLTSSPNGNMMKSKYEWLKRYNFLKYGHVISVTDHSVKTLVQGDLMIDDYHVNLDHANTANVLLYDAPYNKNSAHPRAPHWHDLPLLVERLEVPA